jgi:predicted enzyme related to lactoylglutathione lyase
MPPRTSTLVGAPCWIDLFTSDPGRSRAFYGDLFGWTAEEAGEEYGGYINFSKDGQMVAGCMRNDGQGGMPDVWSVYLSTPDARATADAAAAGGGNVIVPPMDVMELGTMAVVTDPGQAAIGMWQPGLHQGFGVVAEPGAPAWFELHTRDYDASVQFYRDVFGWDTHVQGDAPDFRYTTLGTGDGMQAGIMDASAFMDAGAAAQWSIYFGTADTDASLARIVELGGSVVLPAEDTPFGRLAQAADPTGGLFKLVAAP